MQGGPCGRPMYAAPNGVDEVPVCVMHSRDQGKKEGDLYQQFQREFVATLADAGDGIADFTKYVFPELRFPYPEVKAECYFADAVFWKQVNLFGVNFKRDVWFVAARFEQGWFSKRTVFEKLASFHQATFCEQTRFAKETVFRGEAVFSEAGFQGVVELDGTIFEGEADFGGCTFGDHVRLKKVVFKHDAGFSKAVFKKKGLFQATFEGPADFNGAEFEAEADFSYATFKKASQLQTFFTRSLFLDTFFEEDVDFSQAMFVEEASFMRTKFLGDANFTGATFNGETTFVLPQFHKIANFRVTRFRGRISFSGTAFRTDAALDPGAIFSLARFSDESNAQFYRTDLSHALFHNCDISDVTFSSVIWRKRPDSKTLMVFEEELPLEHEEASALKLGDGSRDYGLIAQLYQRLKKNYDDRLDYWAADDFHYGEMEMQRLAVPTSGPLLGLRAFYHRHLSLIAWYRRGSSYGNSYLRPAMWLCGILLLFTLLFPVTGLRKTSTNPAVPPSDPITYRSAWPQASPAHDKAWAELKLVGKSLLTTIDTATFQRSSEYIPSYPYGRALAILETLLTSTLFALFLLAIRRQFRR